MKTGQMSPQMQFTFSRAFPLSFILIGMIFLYFGVPGLIRAKDSVNWPTAQGKILSSSVKSGTTAGSETKTYAEVTYEFSINGTTFYGDRVMYGGYIASSRPSYAMNIVKRYPKGKKVTVYYMPENPEECLLEPGLKAQSLFLPGLGLVFFCVGSAMIVFLPKLLAKTGTKSKKW